MELKYKLKEKLESLPFYEYQDARRILPELMGVSSVTFRRYMSVTVE